MTPYPLRIFMVLSLFMLVCLSGLAWITLRAAREQLLHDTETRLRGLATWVAAEHTELFEAGAPAGSRAAFRQMAQAGGASLMLLGPDGAVLGETPGAVPQLNYLVQPEVRQALTGRLSSNVQQQGPQADRGVHVATPVMRRGQLVGVVRASCPLRGLDAALLNMRDHFWWGGLLAMLGTAWVSTWLGRRLIRPAMILGKAAERYAKGDFSRRAFLESPAEYAALARTLNRMAGEIEQRFNQLRRERNEREAILASMREGVLAVDLDERIIMLNSAAEELLNIRAVSAVGRLVQEVLRHVALQKYLARAMRKENMSPEDGLLQWEGDRRLQAQWAPLRDETGAESGLLLVLNDVTRLHRLENLRRDFVANVSHELRTPITSIKGFVETLQAGALDDREHAGHFIDIIAHQTERLNSIIEDLLALSRIERDGETEQQINFQNCQVRALILNMAQHFARLAAEKQITLEVACPDDLFVRGRDRLLEQAIGNLIDNAIKYSPPGKPIRIEGRDHQGEAQILVIDHGPGIPPQHHQRLFERFYRVDTARSRELGGTGLGLAIVKHIVQAHRGRVDVQSEVGEGSTFIINLPLARPA